MFLTLALRKHKSSEDSVPQKAPSRDYRCVSWIFLTIAEGLWEAQGCCPSAIPAGPPKGRYCLEEIYGWGLSVLEWTPWNPRETHKVLEKLPSAGTLRAWNKRERAGTKWKRLLDRHYSIGRELADKDHSRADTCYLSWKRKDGSEGRSKGLEVRMESRGRLFQALKFYQRLLAGVFPAGFPKGFGTLSPFRLPSPPLLNQRVYSCFLCLFHHCVLGEESLSL